MNILCSFLITGALATTVPDIIRENDIEGFKLKCANLRDTDLQAAMVEAINYNHPGFVEYLLENGVDVTSTDIQHNFLNLAICNENNAALSMFLKKGVNPNNQLSLAFALVVENDEATWMLLEAGADPNLSKYAGMTPLILAVEKGKEDLVKLLLERGADPAIPDETGATPLIQAVRNKHHEIVRLLLNAAIPFDIDARNKVGMNALGYACVEMVPETIQLLLQHGADPNARNSEGSAALHYVLVGQIMLENCLKESRNDEDEFSDEFGDEIQPEVPVDAPVHPHRFTVIKMLIERGADLYQENFNGFSPFDVIEENLNRGSFKNILEFIQSLDY